MSPPVHTTNRTYDELSPLYVLVSSLPGYMQISDIKQVLTYYYRRLRRNIDRWHISFVIEYMDDVTLCMDNQYTQHVAGRVQQWIRNREISVAGWDYPTYIDDTEEDSDRFHTEIADILHYAYSHYGHNTILESLSTKFAVVPHMGHIYQYIQREITHMRDPTYVFEKNEGTRMIIDVIMEWMHNNAIDVTPL